MYLAILFVVQGVVRVVEPQNEYTETQASALTGRELPIRLTKLVVPLIAPSPH